MKRKLALFFLVTITLCFTAGCASMISGSTQPVTFTSSPDGASVTVKGQVVGKTPAVIVLPRESHQAVEFVKEGYKNETITLDTKFNPWVLANLIWCMSCVFSTTTDYATGAAYEYSPNNYFIALVPEGVSMTPSDIKNRKIKSFIVGNYSSIITELSRMSGDSEQSNSSEYLKTLFTMLEIPEPQRQLAGDKIKTISDGTKDVLIFADEVIKAFIQ